MTLELVLLISFVGMTFVSTFGHKDKGLKAQFEQSGPILAARMERRMATGKCFQVAVGGGTPCGQILFQSASAKK